MNAKQTDIITFLKWGVNLLVAAVSFFIALKLNAIDSELKQNRSDVRQLEKWQAGDIERDIQNIQKLNEILSNQARLEVEVNSKIDRNHQAITDILLLNPQLNTRIRKGSGN